MKILMILSHPSYDTSVANKTIVNELKEQLGDSLQIRHLDAIYPNYHVDVELEQAELQNADLIIFQHPFYWYSVPASLKQWIDSVFTYGFAYGSSGDKLKGKHFIHSLTTAGPKDAYAEGGSNNYTIEQLTIPISQAANLTQMIAHPPVFTNGLSPFDNAYTASEAKKHAEELLAEINKCKELGK